MPTRKKGAGLRWDEANLEANEADSLAADRMKILEPKTPFHTLEEDGMTPAAFPPKAAPARAAGPEDVKRKQFTPGMDLSALTSAALERRVEEPEDDEVEKHRKFVLNLPGDTGVEYARRQRHWEAGA